MAVRRRRLRRLGKSPKRQVLISGGVIALFLLVYLWLQPDGREFLRSPPKHTSLMTIRIEEAEDEDSPFHLQYRWVPLSRISPALIRSVLAAEDYGFFSHGGFDFGEMRAALWDSLRNFRFPRGASTITMQLSKNLYLSESRTPLRKLREAVITKRLERNLGKRRILELYLNIIEWGPGIFGAEAAARHYFGKSASDLSLREAALLAARVPSPLASYHSRAAQTRLSRRAAVIEKRAARYVIPRGYL